MKIRDALKREERRKAAKDRVNDVSVGNGVLDAIGNEDDDASSNSDGEEDHLCLNDDINVTVSNGDNCETNNEEESSNLTNCDIAGREVEQNNDTQETPISDEKNYNSDRRNVFLER
eukprot:CAMPEP_0194405608 /NCGR_PEP_ID=MMETSP0176-20130528/3961_1 /TAXON_ID=216777 /ORGANISM="Proboscia alata, Strain PI-D3" /LENGTH=116 /DNA_ID=CAMNT_0039204475 /DNA_START=446 /DNA_END=796 /DNA_ORIENTATION=+